MVAASSSSRCEDQHAESEDGADLGACRRHPQRRGHDRRLEQDNHVDGEIRGETVVGATPMAVFGAGLLLIGGFFLFPRVTARRTFSGVIAAIGGILVLTSVVLEFTRSY